MSKIITWQAIKDFANSLNEDQLKAPVRWWGDERGGDVESVSALEEDYIRDDEYFSPKSSIEEEALKEIMEDEPEIMIKGTPMIYVD